MREQRNKYKTRIKALDEKWKASDQQLKIRIAAQREKLRQKLVKVVRISARHSFDPSISTVVISEHGADIAGMGAVENILFPAVSSPLFLVPDEPENC